ncbi:hypothetical protein AVEN_102902-1 [Araneus ventricosus]|uniref:Uncharacterized protein n=1 Tax=Araneus ventricosus TaxID=182803 RepID=A0A4Y2MAF9_ARAVE|nr:hypothetical protein AVEN_102902-1 [Araneus ventricosus]
MADRKSAKTVKKKLKPRLREDRGSKITVGDDHNNNKCEMQRVWLWKKCLKMLVKDFRFCYSSIGFFMRCDGLNSFFLLLFPFLSSCQLMLREPVIVNEELSFLAWDGNVKTAQEMRNVQPPQPRSNEIVYEKLFAHPFPLFSFVLGMLKFIQIKKKDRLSRQIRL